MLNVSSNIIDNKDVVGVEKRSTEKARIEDSNIKTKFGSLKYNSVTINTPPIRKFKEQNNNSIWQNTTQLFKQITPIMIFNPNLKKRKRKEL